MCCLPIFKKGSKAAATEEADVADDAYIDGQVADQALEVLRRVKDKPFFLAVGFRRPHLPFSAPKKYWDMYDREKDPPARPAHSRFQYTGLCGA